MSSAPAKIILLGEHAVVYDAPAIAAPVSALRTRAIVQAEQGHFRIVAHDLGETIIAGRDQNELLDLTAAFCDEYDVTLNNLEVHIESDIPVSSGMGSGAAVSTALLRSLFTHFGIEVSLEQLNAMVYDAEKAYHGTPSGIDNTVIVYEKPLYFMRGTDPEFLPVASPFRLCIADTGVSARTKDAIADVRELRNTQPARVADLINMIRALVQHARDCIETGNHDELGQLLTENHKILQELTVSSSELDHLVTAALEAGAMGAKLSGGGRGGNMIALVNQETQAQVEHALYKAGAKQVFVTEVKSS